MSDIKFDGEWIIVEGHWLKVRTLDLMLDAPSRRNNTSGNRRALVHDFGDALTINYNGDYPGGVRIKGKVSMDAIVGHQTIINSEDVVLDSAGRRSNTTGQRRALVHDFSDGLTINWGSDYPGGVTINGMVKVPARMMIAGVDIVQQLDLLKTEIQQLKTRVADLEKKR